MNFLFVLHHVFWHWRRSFPIPNDEKLNFLVYLFMFFLDCLFFKCENLCFFEKNSNLCSFRWKQHKKKLNSWMKGGSWVEPAVSFLSLSNLSLCFVLFFLSISFSPFCAIFLRVFFLFNIWTWTLGTRNCIRF